MAHDADSRRGQDLEKKQSERDHKNRILRKTALKTLTNEWGRSPSSSAGLLLFPVIPGRTQQHEARVGNRSGCYGESRLTGIICVTP